MLLKAKISIKGKRPILFHSFSNDSISLVKKETTGVPGNDPQEWKRTVLKTKENQLYLEPTYIFGCLREGGKYLKSGRGTFQSKIASTLTVLDEIILLDRFLPEEDKLTQDKSLPVYLDVRSVKNPSTKGRNVRYRIAANSGWGAIFNIIWEGTIVSREHMEECVINAGSFVGLGDARSIGFGRFEVEKFSVKETYT
jgi:hypothetical protein